MIGQSLHAVFAQQKAAMRACVERLALPLPLQLVHCFLVKERGKSGACVCSYMFSYTGHSLHLFLHFVPASNYFAGNRYVLKGDTAVMLLFDSQGKIAGIQNGVSKTT